MNIGKITNRDFSVSVNIKNIDKNAVEASLDASEVENASELLLVGITMMNGISDKLDMSYDELCLIFKELKDVK